MKQQKKIKFRTYKLDGENWDYQGSYTATEIIPTKEELITTLIKDHYFSEYVKDYTSEVIYYYVTNDDSAEFHVKLHLPKGETVYKFTNLGKD